MTALTFMNPYAPQTAQPTATDMAAAVPAATVEPLKSTSESRDPGTASDQSGDGAGNGTNTGGAQIGTLLERARSGMKPQDATPESVVEAQSEEGPAAQFLDRQARQREQATAAAEQRAADAAFAAARAAKQEAEAAARKASMPDPLPTAPILANKG